MLHDKFNNYDVHLVESVEELEQVKKVCMQGAMCGLDTETSGLSFITDEVAGVCISGGRALQPGHYHGFYLPVRHSSYPNNLPLDKVMELTQWLYDNCKVALWNRNFDNTMLEKDGVIIPCPGNTHDIQLMAWNIKNEPFPALKDYSEKLLKFSVIHYEENSKGQDMNFMHTDPTVSYIYAAGDPILTALLGQKIWMDYPHVRKIYPLDNTFAEVMRRIMQQTGVWLDKKKVQELLDDNIRQQNELKRQIFNITGYPFRLTAAADKADALSRFVTLTVKTKSGKWDTSEEVLSQIDHPLAKLLIEFSHLEKFRSTYLSKMIDFPQPFRINYKHCDVATGRLSSGQSRGNDFYANFNIQNVPKKEVIKHLHWAPVCSKIKWYLRSDPFKPLGSHTPIMTSDGPRPLHTIKPGDIVRTPTGDKPVRSIGVYKDVLKLVKQGSLSLSDGAYIKRDGEEWKRTEATELSEDEPWFIDIDDDTYSVCIPHGAVQVRTLQHMKCKGAMREAFTCPPSDDPNDPYIWISADYSSQEMVLLANFSKEPVLIEALNQGADIHKFVALKMFGFYNKTQRGIAKAINFSVNYGGGPSTIAANLNKSFEEAQQLLNKYNETLSHAYTWRQAMAKEARRKGLICSYFGRPRILSHYYSSSDKGLWAFADRCAMNSPIQGTGGDLIRMDYIKYYKKQESDPEWKAKVKHILTVDCVPL